MPKRHCVEPGCPTLTNTTRCPTHQQAWARARNTRQAQRYDHTWRTDSQHLRQAHVARYGWWCPGWETPSHQSFDLVVDHDLGVMCRQCNSAKAGSWDKRNPHR